MYALLYFLVVLQLVSAKKIHDLLNKEEWEEQKTIWPGMGARQDSLRVMGEKAPAPYKPTYTTSEELGGECKFEDFKIQAPPISSTLFSNVYKAVHEPTGTAVIVKEATKIVMQVAPHVVHTEEMLQHDLKHENIAKVYCSMMPTPEVAYLVLPYYEEGDLENALVSPSLNRERAMSYLRQLLGVVHFLHANGIGHFDIKPSNLVLANGGETIKLLDFGIAAYSSGDDQEGMRGTPGYMAPEVLKGKFGRAADYYAVAATTYALFTKGRMPWMVKDLKELEKLAKEYLEKGLTFPSTGYRPADHLIKELSEYDPKKRWVNGYENYDALLVELSRSYSPMMVISIVVVVILVASGAAALLWLVIRRNRNSKVVSSESQKA